MKEKNELFFGFCGYPVRLEDNTYSCLSIVDGFNNARAFVKKNTAERYKNMAFDCGYECILTKLC